MRNDDVLAAPGVTVLLHAWIAGDASALERLTPIVYSELHRLAHRQMVGERHGHVLQPSALVNEAFVRLMGGGGAAWENRQQFFAAAARLMRQFGSAALARKKRTDDGQHREISQTQGSHRRHRSTKAAPSSCSDLPSSPAVGAGFQVFIVWVGRPASRRQARVRRRVSRSGVLGESRRA
jgi:hypothetical protein